MAQGQLVQFGFHTGIDEKTDPKSAPPGTIVELVNMRQGKTGQLERRPGHTALSRAILRSGGGNVSACARLATNKNELLLSDASNLYSYSETLSNWITRGRVPNCVSRFEIIKQFDSDWTDPQYAYSAGLEVFSCTLSPNNAILAFARDVASGTIVSQPLIVGSLGGGVYQSCVCITGSYACVCFTDTGGNLKLSIMDLNNIAAGWSATVTLETDAITTGSPLVIHELPSNKFVLVYAQSSGGTQKATAINVTITSATTAAVNTQTNISGVASALLGAFGLDYDSSTNVVYFVASLAAPSFRIASFDATTLVTSHSLNTATTAQAGQSGVIVMSPTDIRLLVTFDGKTQAATYYTTDNNVAALTQAGRFYFGHIKTNLWAVGSAVYVLVRYAKTNFVCELVTQSVNTHSPLRPTCTVTPRTAYSAPQEASGEATLNFGLPRVFNVGGAHYRAISTQIADASINSRNGLVVHDMTFGDDWLLNNARYPAQHLQPVEFGSLLHFSGGMPSSYDGNRLVEMSFLFGPQVADIPGPTIAAVGGSLGQGTYQYQFAYEWTDDAGNVYRSEPSAPYTVTTVGVGLVNKVTWKVPNLFLTMKSTYPTTGTDSPSTQVAIIAYRTTVNGDGSVFYRQTSHTVPSTNLSQTGNDYVTIADATSDADLTAAATASLLYTNGGTLAGQAPPSLTCLVKHRRRICGIGDDGRTVWFSSEFVDREALKWNDALLIEFDEPLTAIASMDDRLLAFSRDSVWFVTGDGPNDLGQGSDWSSPVRVQSDSGCVDPRSVISMSDGVMFRSFTGFYFIDRQLNVQFVGGLIEDTADTNALDVCSLFQAHGETSCFLSMVPSSGSSTGVRLQWDTYRKMWAKDLLTDGSSTGAAVAGITSWKGSVAWATTGGQVYVQTDAAWTDNGHWYDSSFTTAFISSGGPLGWQRVRYVQMDGDYITPHDIKLSLAFDFDDNFYQTFTWKAASQATSRDVDVKMRVGSQNGANPRCQGLKIKYEMLTPTTPSDYPIGTGQAATLSGVGLMIVPKSGVRRVGAGVSV